MTLILHFILRRNITEHWSPLAERPARDHPDVRGSPKISTVAKRKFSHLAPTTSSFCPGSNVNCEKSTASFARNSRNQGPISKQEKQINKKIEMNVFPPGSIASANITFQTGFEGPPM